MSASPPQLPGVTHHFVDVKGLRVHVAEAGSGPPLVLLHGWPQDHRAWSEVYPRLADRFRVIMPDMRGLGWTDAPVDGPYLKEQLASDLIALLDALELEKVALVGHDWGGMVGFLATLRAPERFRGFLALSISGPWPGPTWELLKVLPRFVYMLVVASPFGAWVIRNTALISRINLIGSRNNMSPEKAAAYGARYAEPERAWASTGYYRTFLTTELGPIRRGKYVDQRVAVPCRVVVGTHDPAIREPLLRGIERRGDDIRVVWVEGAGHFLPEERPETVVEHIDALFGDG